VTVLVLGAWGTLARQTLAAGQAQNGPIERGKYLVDTSGCHECHTPKNMGANGPEPDTTRLLSGFPQDRKFPPPPKLAEGPWMAVAAYDLTAWSGPWGISYAANLTPDKDTGLGNWTPEVFISAIRTGKHMGVARPILPPMPWQTISKMTDEDLRGIFAYLKSLPPVKNAVPAPVPPAK
jgi:cytochrome c